MIVSRSVAQDSAAGPAVPSNLRCEYLTDPIGIDVVQPRLSWVLEHSERGQKQTAYQILVSTRPDLLTGDVWDSGRLESDQSTHVVYGGKPLQSGRTYFWKVRYWDKNGSASPYSSPARFETGLLSAAEWTGQWIGGANQLRKEFVLASKPIRARAYIAGLGYYELRLNGKKVGHNVLDPAWTVYDKRILYTTYDVTDYLQQGPNAVAVILGQGWFASRALLLQLDIEPERGKQLIVVSDTTWKVAQGPIVSDSIYDGEVYDARRETPGWDQPGCKDVDWQAAKLVESPKGTLSAQMMPPIQVVDTIVPLHMSNPQPGAFVYDLGQNISGWVRLRVRGHRGAAVKLRFAELLYDNGMINTENLRKAKAADIYILRGGGEEIYEPRFTYHGFRYVEMTGFPGAPRLDTLRGQVVHSAVKPAGGFSCSKPILNQLQRIILWGQKTNLHSIPTDCSQRDERMGWMGDAHVTAEEAMLNFDMAAFYTNFLRDIRDSQGQDGTITDTVPHKWGRRPADPAWGAAFPLICWYMYQHYGDRRVLEENYEGIKKWVDYLHSRSQDGLLNYSYYGDWVSVEKTPGSLVSSFYYAYGLEIVARMAEILGNQADTQSYRQLSNAAKEAFHRKFFNDETAQYAGGTQTANTLALYLDMVPKEKRGAVVANLVHDILYRHDTHLTTGFIGVKYLIELLARIGRSDLAYELVTQKTYPSWGYMIENGATTLWELWQNKTGPSMNSHNHPMFGSVGTFLYEALAGIQMTPTGAGYRELRIAPQIARDLRWASGTVETIRGTLVSAWTRLESGVRLEVAIPVGSGGEIVLPKLNLRNVAVKEGDRIVWKDGSLQPGVSGLVGGRETDQALILQTGSGRYVFELNGQ